MTKVIEDKLLKIPIVNILVRFGKKIKIPGLQGMSSYDLLEMYFIGILKGALTSRAGAIAFSFFMALFPFLLFILTLIPYIQIEGFQEDFMFALEQFLPPTTSESVDLVIKDIAINRYGGLLSFGFITSIFLMTNGVNAIFGGFEYSYHVKVTRNVIKQFMVALGVSIVLSLLLILTVAIIIYFEIVIQNFKARGWVQDDVYWIQVGRIIFFVIMIYTAVSILYNYGVKDLKQRSYFTPGAILTTLLTVLMFYLFGIYVERFAQYNQLYGSIGTLLILMLFIWLNSVILLLGFELNASMNRLRLKHKLEQD
ncbi:YihY/virulence factor BrkB family protein [Urechidicola croceus]|uniref:Ribonuclease BN n=1 Tax=Urechidicola croceus TaxID=1850246 RepID=A0A1D8P4D1_9FLAO|nr:YihY/virulence factor BrkB family protein [Urechidicola croceus]AOW19429.1 ribonuclease BN [Urechidicola croceus]